LKIDVELGLNKGKGDAVSLPEPTIDPAEIFIAWEATPHIEPTRLVKPEGKAQPNGSILLPSSVGSPLAEKKEKSTSQKPKEQGTWVRLPRPTKIPIKGADDCVVETKREPIQKADPRPSKHQNTSEDDVLCSIPAAVAVVQPRRKP